MQPIRDVLYLERHLDGAGRGLSCAAETARLRGARLTVAAHVPIPWNHAPPPPDSPRWALARDRVRRRLQALLSRQSALEPDEIRLRVLVGGEAVRTVMRQVEASGHDLVMTVAHTETGGRSPFSSSDQKLLRSCPCPVWILDPAQRGRPEVVVVGVDAGPARSRDFNRAILHAAGELAGASGADLHVVHAWSTMGESFLATPLAGVSRGRLREARTRALAERTDALRELVGSVPAAGEAHVHLREGNPGRVLRRAVDRLEADVLVLGHSRRGGIARLVVGNLSERLLGRVHTSLLVLKAPGRTAAPARRVTSPVLPAPPLLPGGMA